MYSIFFYENVFKIVSYDFQSSMGLKKLKCDVFSGTTQGHDCPWIIY
jgi:hypothetical protein